MIQIKDSQLATAAKKGMDEFLQVFTDAYLEAIGGNLTAENMSLLNGSQHTLLAHRFFQDEMRDGGFVQLIQNGYGGYIFSNPFAKAIKQFGAVELSKLVYKAKEIYDPNKTELERETTEEEFNAMYVDFEVFDDLEEMYFEMEERQTSLIAAYVDEHITDFAEITQD
ncbi:MAG: DMP19 family protein [Paludibacter sp.]|nr:DMP19 family protein [Paludibacter sp.]MBP7612133.1 DMP19 family protein [Paludibacter sp.]